jgi:hypothetical protein
MATKSPSDLDLQVGFWQCHIREKVNDDWRIAVAPSLEDQY